MKTNKTISIYQVTKTWKGEETSALLGEYDVWLEHGEQYNYKVINTQSTATNQMIRTKLGEGFVIIGEDLTLRDCYLLFDGIRYDIHSPEKFWDRKGNFHHMEFYYG